MIKFGTLSRVILFDRNRTNRIQVVFFSLSKCQIYWNKEISQAYVVKPNKVKFDT